MVAGAGGGALRGGRVEYREVLVIVLDLAIEKEGTQDRIIIYVWLTGLRLGITELIIKRKKTSF